MSEPGAAHQVLTRCPVCGDDLRIVRLECPACGSALHGNFTLGRLARLTREQLQFVEVFIRCRGKIKDVEEELSISYPTVVARLNEVVHAMGFELPHQQKITAAEPAELPPAADRARWFRVRVTDQRSGRTRTDVSVPIGMVGFGLGFARRFRNMPGVAHVDDLFEAVRAGRRGTIFDVSNEGGERVEIFID